MALSNSTDFILWGPRMSVQMSSVWTKVVLRPTTDIALLRASPLAFSPWFPHRLPSSTFLTLPVSFVSIFLRPFRWLSSLRFPCSFLLFSHPFFPPHPNNLLSVYLHTLLFLLSFSFQFLPHPFPLSSSSLLSNPTRSSRKTNDSYFLWLCSPLSLHHLFPPHCIFRSHPGTGFTH